MKVVRIYSVIIDMLLYYLETEKETLVEKECDTNFKSYDEKKTSLNPPFSSVYLCSKILPNQIVFEEINKK